MSERKWTPGPWRLAEVWRPRIGNLPPHMSKRNRRADDGNVFWGYSISGSNEGGASILPTLAAVHNFPDNIKANATLIAASPDLAESATEIDRLFLVIESAVRYADPNNRPAVLAALKANRAALSKALGSGGGE